jgi:hypothetical protein
MIRVVMEDCGTAIPAGKNIMEPRQEHRDVAYGPWGRA